MKKLILAIVVGSLLLPQAISAQSVASFSWSSQNMTVGIGQTQSITLSLNTAGQETTGADVELSYEPSKLEITGVAFSNPTLYPQNFHTINENTRRITLRSTFTDVSGMYKGSGSYVTLTVRGKVAGTTALSVVCNTSATNDTNVIQKGTGKDIVNCGSVSNLTVNVSSGTSPTPPPPTTPTQPPSNTNPSSTQCSALRTSPTGFTATAQSATSVLLRFTKEPNSSHYTLLFGTQPGKYQYGASNIGNVNAFIVNYLSPGTTYYFALAGVNACSTSSFITAQTKTLSAGTTTIVRATTRATPRVTPQVPSTIGSVATPFIPVATLAPAFSPSPQFLAEIENVLSFDNYLSQSPLPEENLLGERPTPVANTSAPGTSGKRNALIIGIASILIFIVILVVIALKRARLRGEVIDSYTAPSPEPKSPTKEEPSPDVSAKEILQNEKQSPPPTNPM